jgi:class 3 adenylate cyclase
VTALFADIKGSMELIEDLDPEEAHRLVDPALKLVMDAGASLQGLGGAIDQGWHLLLFGAPVAHVRRCPIGRPKGSHPRRAVR